MNKEILEVQAYNGICEAIGCFANATHKIAIKVGTLGIISIFVCSDCIPIFQEPITKCNLEQSEAEQSLVSQNEREKALEQVGSQGSNTILCKSTSMDFEEQRR